MTTIEQYVINDEANKIQAAFDAGMITEEEYQDSLDFLARIITGGMC